MKKFIQLSAIFFGLIISHNVYSQNYNDQSYQATDCPVACPQVPDTECDEWKLMCHQQPCPYNSWKCVEEQVPCKKQCCRYVPKYYEVDKCRYVPQHYKETYCRYEKENYEVEDSRTCKKWVCEQKCKYTPKYYWKHTGSSDNCAEIAKPSSCE